jgi:hypothetical protein
VRFIKFPDCETYWPDPAVGATQSVCVDGSYPAPPSLRRNQVNGVALK